MKYVELVDYKIREELIKFVSDLEDIVDIVILLVGRQYIMF